MTILPNVVKNNKKVFLLKKNRKKAKNPEKIRSAEIANLDSKLNEYSIIIAKTKNGITPNKIWLRK